MKSFRGDLWRSIALAFLVLLCASSPAFAGSQPASISSTFADVTPSHWAYDYIERLFAEGITKGCGYGIYCPENNATRAEAAVFTERVIHGSNFEPPSASGIFVDVPDGYWAKDWIGQLFLDGITTGATLTPLKYYPESPVTRAEMAIFLLKAKHYGEDYIPPAATGIFEDVPSDYWAADWIEALYHENITTGCESSSLKYCPEGKVSRAEMAVFFARALQPTLVQNGIFGYSTANHFFTQAVSDQGMGEQVSAGDLNNTYDSMTSFTMADGRQYIFGLRKSGDWSIQEVLSTGDLGKEICFGTWEHYYPILSAFTFPGGKTFIYGQMQVTDNEEDSSFWIIMEVKQGGIPELQPTLVDDGYWDKWYPNALVTNPNSPSPMLFIEDSDGNWFLRPISADGKVQREDPYMHQFGDYYGSVQTFIVGSDVFLFVQSTDGGNEWEIWRITKNEPFAMTDAGVWNNYYNTVASYSINGRTFLLLQSGTYWKIMEVSADGKMGSQIGADGNWGNHYDFIFPIYVDPAYLNPSSWMTDMYDLLKDRTLQDIAIPGSHDAGMSELQVCSTYGNACNTQTQTGAIYEQLTNGARYFDIRPTSYVDCWGSFTGWYTGHWAWVNGEDWQGCMGQSLDSVLDDVAKFCTEMWPIGGKELIILNFSHCYDIVAGDDCDDWTGSDCSDNEWVDDVRNTAVEKLSAFLIDWSKYEDPREAIFGDRAANQHVLLRFETEAISTDPQNGVYNSDDFPIYNNYSNTNTFSTMSDDQEQKLINPENHSVELFLLSWTLTLSSDQAFDCGWDGDGISSSPTSILDLAGEADSQLMNYIYDWSSLSPVITQTLLPNVIYVDNFGTFATRAAIYINQNYSTLPP